MENKLKDTERKGLPIAVKVFLILLLYVAVLILCLWAFQTVKGIHTLFTSKGEVKSELENVSDYTIHYKNKDIDVTDTIRSSADDTGFKFGKKNVKIHKYVDMDKLKKSLGGIKLSKVRCIDYENLADTLSSESCNSIDLDKYIVDKYSSGTTEKYNKLVNWRVSYTKGVNIKSPKKYVKISNTGKVTIDDNYIDKITSKVESKYNTVGNTFKLKGRDKKIHKIKSSYSTWGDKVDSDKEKQFLKKSWLGGKSLSNRTPIFSQNTGEIGKTYTEVSISKQKVWYVKNGKTVLSSSCVTGRKGVHDTPTGVFFISEKINGKYLTGDNYRTWVNKWLRLTWSGIGLHDASWRGSYGGNIYKYNGSHGCINLPYSFVSKLFNKVNYGDPVIVYY